MAQNRILARIRAVEYAIKDLYNYKVIFINPSDEEFYKSEFTRKGISCSWEHDHTKGFVRVALQ
jgi:hypothetical protein